MQLYYLFLLFFIIHHISCELINDNMKSFSYANKQDRCYQGKEIVLYERNDGPGVITEQWYTGYDCFNQFTTLRYYIDGDEEPTIEGNLYLMHGIGVYNNITHPQGGPWGTKWVGLTAHGGGLYNTFRIPYQKSFRVSFIPEGSGAFWYIIRGMQNYPVIIGDLKLPSTAKLVLQKIDRLVYPPYAYLTAASSKKSGMLFMTTLAGDSRDYNYLEGCFRLLVDNHTDIQYLSSGTEDFFLSAYYYNDGIFHTDHSGLTVLMKPGAMSAYKFFVADPLIFQNRMSLIWRVGEKRDNLCYNGSPERCYHGNDGNNAYCRTEGVSDHTNTRNVQLADTQVSMYVWFYEW